MKWLNSLKRRSSIIGELFAFLWHQRLWWLIPMVTILILFGILLIIGQSTPVAPFIYTLF